MYADLDRLEPGVFDTLTWRPRTDLWPLLLAVALLLLLGFEVWMVLRTTLRERRVAHV